MKIRSAFLELLHLDGRTEIKKEKIIYLVFFSKLTQTVTQLKYIVADCCSQTDTVTFVFSVLLHSTFTVQILYKLYSLQPNCTYSNYTEAAVTCSAAQQHTNCPADVF
jgi:hypothetical protein